MNLIDELALHVQALDAAVDANEKFFAPIVHYLKRLRELVTTAQNELDQSELRILADNIDKFYVKWRPIPNSDDFYVPPRETDDTDESVQQINRIVQQLVQMPKKDFELFLPSTAPTKDRSEATVITERSKP